MSIKDNPSRLIGALAALTVALGFLALHHASRDHGSDPARAAARTTQGADSPPAPTAAPAARTGAVPESLRPGRGSSPGSAAPVQWEPLTFDPKFHVYVPREHEHHEYTDQDRFSTETLKVYAHNGDALAAFFVGSRLFWTDPEAGAEYLKLATVLSGKAGPLDVLAKKYSRGGVEDLEQAYLLGYAAAAIGYYEGYEEIVPKTERILWKRYDLEAASNPDFSAEKAMARLRARRAEIVRELNRSPLIQIDDSLDYPRIETVTQPTAREGE